MNSWVELISNRSGNLAPLFLDAALNSFIILLVTGIAVLLWRRGSAAARHAVWFAGVVSLLCLPVFSLIMPASQKPLWRLSTNAKSDNELVLTFEFDPNRAAPLLDPTPQMLPGTSVADRLPAAKQITSHLHIRWLMLVSLIWSAGAMAVLGYAMLGRLRLRRIRKRARPFPSADLLDSICHELGIARTVTLLQSADDLVPMTWGWRHPVVLLPAQAEQWPTERLEIVLRHELAHVKRWDSASQFISQIACALYWFNPLVWLAARRMCVERERACDDLVLEGGCKASNYASHLLDIARSFRRVPQVAAISMARSSQLQNRITAIVDASRARRAPRGFVLSILWAAMLSLVATIAAQKSKTSDSETKSLHERQIARLRAFSVAKEKQSRTLAVKAEGEISPEFRKFFDVAMKGDVQTVTNMFEDFHRRRGRTDAKGELDPDMSLRTSYWHPVLEIAMAYYDVMAGEPKYTQIAVDDIIGSIPRGSIYFGGTDPGRSLPTAFCKSHVDADPFFTLSQNALTDGAYLDYLRSMYGRNIYILTKEEADKCFQDYLADAEKRFDHDSKFPNEPRQIQPGEDIRKVENKVQVSGQMSVIAVRAMMCKIIFDKNPDREFYIEESFPLDWMYPYLEPHRLVMKMNRQRLETIPEEVIQRDHAHWQKLVDGMIGKWLTEETPVQTIAEFAERVYARHDLSGFSGDVRFVQNGNAQKMFSKWRSSIAGLYNWRIPNSKSPAAQQTMIKEADFAFRQAFAIYPSSVEAVFRYVNLLISRGRVDDAIRIAEAFVKVSPDNTQARNLVSELHRLKATQRK